MSVMFPFVRHPGLIPVYRKNSLYYSQAKKPLGSWNLVNPLLSMNEAWTDKCAARLQPLTDQYKNPYSTAPNNPNRKISRFDRNNPTMPWGQKHLFLDILFLEQSAIFEIMSPVLTWGLFELRLLRFNYIFSFVLLKNEKFSIVALC